MEVAKSDDEVVGFEKDAENIMKILIGEPKELNVLSIFGMPGLGKTTLARKVYNNPCIVEHFDIKVWCAVSQAYNRRTLLVEIFKQATNDNSEIEEDVDIIADKLQKALKGKRYLIVLDDIWEVKAWEDLCLCFPKGEYRSRVMVTTRIERVAAHLQQSGEPYSLRFLTPEESWELLEKKVFHGEKCPPDLLEAGLQVAQHCKGLPLVIVLISGIIKMERHPSMWMEIANDLSSYVLGEQSMKVMQSSYDHLEDHLKACLFYMALFPEDWRIPVSDLMLWWIAEEFVLNVDKENMEEASRIYFNDLLNRSLVMLSLRNDITGDVELCILHDVVREFCLRKLAEEKFMQLTVPYNPYQRSYCKESRLSIYIHDDLVKQLDHYEYQLDKIPMLDTKCFGECPVSSLEFIAHPKFNTWKTSNQLPLFQNLRLVRMLKFTEEYLPRSWPSAVESLTHLRYLEILAEEFDLKWVSHLLNLQTLIVRSHYRLKTSLGPIWKMTKLRLVQISKLVLVWEDNDRAIFEETSTTMLENLKIFRSRATNIDDTTPRFWWRFPIIEELSLSVKGITSCPLFPIVDVHTRLQSLKLVATNSGLWDSVGCESYFVLPSNIRCLCLHGDFLTEGMLSNIARLQKLEELRIEQGFPSPWAWRKSENHYWDVTNVEFPSLKYLALKRVQMKEWKASDESFPVLEKLLLQYCSDFKEIPPSFANSLTLQHIRLVGCIDSLGDSAMNIKREIEENTGSDTLQVDI